MSKSRDAFRTISEVGEAIDTPAHVLRFWESKFKQVKPVKRAGGRRYYRPDDLALLRAIKDLLHEQGYAIKEAQKIIREAGVKSIVAKGHRLLDYDVDGTKVKSNEDPTEAEPNQATPVAANATTQPNLFTDAETAAAPPPAPEVVNTSAPTKVIAPVEFQDSLFGQDTSAEPEPATYPEPESEPLSLPEHESLEDLEPIVETKSAITLPPVPDLPASGQSRILAHVLEGNPDVIKANAAQIAPLVERLSALRDELRHTW